MNSTEQNIEQAIDRAVMRRLSTDRAYLNAENAEEQAEREQQITDQEEARIVGTSRHQTCPPAGVYVNPRPWGCV